MFRALASTLAFLSLTMAMLLMAISPLFAQSRQDPGTRLLEENNRAKQLEQLEKARPGQEFEVPEPEQAGKEDFCFKVNIIRLQGVTVLKAGNLEQVLAPYKNTCMGQKAIEALIQRINKMYIDAGYITSRAYVPEQDLSNGELLIAVIEGRIEGFVYRVVGKDGKVNAGKPRKIYSAFPAKPGDIFQLRDIEQGLDQMNRLASSNAKLELLPGSAEGTSLIVITEQKVDQNRGTVSYDNKGSDTTGVNRFSLTHESDDLLSLNDYFSATYLGTQNTNVFAYDFSIPKGYWTFSSSGSYSESSSPLTIYSDLFNQSTNLNFRMERLISRDAKQKTSLYGQFNYFRNSRFINLSELTPQNRTSLSAGIHREHFYDKGVFSYDLGGTFGLPVGEADRDLDHLPFDAPRAEFAKLDFSLSNIYRLDKIGQLYSNIVGQWANVPLYSNEQISIGGWDSIRGYHGLDASGGRGIMMRNDFYFNNPLLMQENQENAEAEAQETSKWGKSINEFFSSWQPYAFLDAGVVHDKVLDETNSMVGAGIGIRGNWKNLSVDAALAFPLKEYQTTKPGDVQGLINVRYKVY